MKLVAKDLKIKFVEALSFFEDFTYDIGNPFLISIGAKQYFVFLKNLSPAYFKNLPDITRVQLPHSSHFPKITKVNIPFVILGYDSLNDVFVSWNPKRIKRRLNVKSNVSLYSRQSLQNTVNDDVVLKKGYLSNGEEIILFRRINLVTFFNAIKYVFKDEVEHVQVPQMINSLQNDLEIDNTEILDSKLLEEIKMLIEENKILKAVELYIKYFDAKGQVLSFKDAFDIVNKQHKVLIANSY